MENDSKNELIEALRKAARGPSRSKIARLREIFEDVEAAKALGLSHKQIVATLEKQGLKFDLGTFEITRFRILKERRLAEGSIETRNFLNNEVPKKIEKATQVKSKLTETKKEKLEEGELERPPGITSAAWSEMLTQHRAEQRRLRKLIGE